MNATADDVMRIMQEQQAIADREEFSDHRTMADDWASSRGMEEGTMAMICNGVIHAFEETVIALSAEEYGEEPEIREIDGTPHVRSTDAAFRAALEMTILSSFRWGFETARQLR